MLLDRIFGKRADFKTLFFELKSKGGNVNYPASYIFWQYIYNSKSLLRRNGDLGKITIDNYFRKIIGGA